MSNDILQKGRELAESCYRDGEGFKNTGRKDAYRCTQCYSYIVTIDRDPGVTPLVVKCGNCGGDAHSSLYNVPAFIKPTHEWYRPDSLDSVDTAYYEHIERGGLILRPIGDDVWLNPEGLYKEAAESMRKYARIMEEVGKDEKGE